MAANLAIQIPEYKKTTQRVITRRGVLWLGQTCNLRCHFCYFLDRINQKNHPEHPFMEIDKAKQICSILVDYYGNNAIDIQGGEPTIYRHIDELVEHCRAIGLLPSLITNALVLSHRKVCLRLKDAGIRDLLVSVQGLGDTYNLIVGVEGAYDKQLKGLENAADVGIPLRFNCVLSKPALPQLEKVAGLAKSYSARVVNFIAFNPFEDQQLSGRRSDTNVPQYSEVRGYLNKALDILDEANIEANVRYFPICMIEPHHRQSMYNFQQLSFDVHEWDYASWSWTGQQPQRMKDGAISPTVKLCDTTYRPMQYVGPLKHVANGVKQLVHNYPAMRPSAEKIHRTISNIVNPNIIYGEPQDEDAKRHLYRENAKMRASAHCRYVYSKACDKCAAKKICDGFHGDYAEIFGTDEAEAIDDEGQIDNPIHYISEQRKVVEIEDYEWAL